MVMGIKLNNLHTVNVLKFQTLYFLLFGQDYVFIQLFLKILSGIANSVDPDQGAV